MLRIVRHLLAGLIVSLAASTLTAAAPSDSVAQRPASRPAAKLLPRDDSASDPTFLSFRNRLIDAARRGDHIALRPLLADVVRASFDEMPAEQLLERLRPAEPWRELVEALELGTTRESNGDGGHYFIAPYVSSDTNDRDGYEELAIIGRRVRLRRDPHPRAEILALLTYDVVSVVHELGVGRDEILRLDSPKSWAAVRIGDGTVGYVFARYVRSSMDMRYYFEKVNGRWLMTALAAGD